MKQKKHGSVFAGLLVVLLMLVVAGTIASNLIFSGGRVPKIAGYYLYLQDSNEMMPDIPAQSLVVAQAAITGEIHEGNKVLCYLADGTLAVRNIYRIEEMEDGAVNYYPGTVQEQGTDFVIPRTNIFAICTWASTQLYQYVKFTTSMTGLMALLVAPCVILIIMLLVKMAKSDGDDMEDEEFLFEQSEPTPRKKKKKAAQQPLYNPDEVPVQDSLQEKKSTISENFSAKPVNENSPYQKAVQEREKTMKFRRQEIEQEALKVLNEPLPKKKKTVTQVYSTDEIKAKAKEIQNQNQNQTSDLHQKSAKPEPEQPTASNQTNSSANPVSKSTTRPIPEKNFFEKSTTESVSSVPVIPQEKKTMPKPVPKSSEKPAYRSISPNIDDILNAPDRKSTDTAKSTSGSRTNSVVSRTKSDIAQTDSIDDLIKLLEKKKSNL
ncbi:MAG: hypothetical protein K2H29_05040 [Oscillospiraceae bacterium]|nr:hypothetical protein [Oscillospiraceae bacterium]